jgi:hypothetical protein
MNSTERHAALIDAGWHVNLDGKWISPNPNDARFSFNLNAAWRAHLTHLDQQQPPPPAA